MMKKSVLLNKDFWNNRYIESKTGWDVGVITSPVKKYFDQLNDKTIKILYLSLSLRIIYKSKK